MKSPVILGMNPSITRGSPFVQVQWEGTRPSISGLIPPNESGLEAVPSVLSAISAKDRHEFRSWQASHAKGMGTPEDGFLKWVASRPVTRPLLPYQTESYDLHQVPLEERFWNVPYLGFAHVPPTEIFGFPKKYRPPESVHHFYFHVSGDYFILGFESDEVRDAYLKDFETKVLPADAPRDVLSFGGNFFAGGWRSAGRLSVEGRNLSLALFTPRAFETLKKMQIYQSAPDDFFSAPGIISETTSDGTTYFFNASRDFLGIQNANGNFRVARALKPAEAYNTASHASILQRQLDPYGLGVVSDNAWEQFMIGDRLVVKMLDGFGYSRGMARMDAPLPPIEEISATARRRLAGFAEKAVATAGETSALRMGIAKTSLGLDSWMTNPQMAGRHKYLRFLWLSGSEADSGLIVSDGQLLHSQIARLAFDENLFSSGFRVPGNGLMDHLRGGTLELKYDREGRVATVRLFDGGMLFPDPGTNRAEGVRVRMSQTERDEFHRQMKESLK